MICITVCSGIGNIKQNSSTQPINNIPYSFQCLPTQLSSTQSEVVILKLIFAYNCSANITTEPNALKLLSAFLEVYSVSYSSFLSNCISVTLQYNSGFVGVIITIAHCVTSESKIDNTAITQNNNIIL